jgi:hypothetical protein
MHVGLHMDRTRRCGPQPLGGATQASVAGKSDGFREAAPNTQASVAGRSDGFREAAPKHTRHPAAGSIHALLKRGSYYWLPNRDAMSYSACQIGPSHPIGFSYDDHPALTLRRSRRAPCAITTETSSLCPAAKQGPSALLWTPNRTDYIPLVSAMPHPHLLHCTSSSMQCSARPATMTMTSGPCTSPERWNACGSPRTPAPTKDMKMLLSALRCEDFFSSCAHKGHA